MATKNNTIDDLAVMVQKGFDEVNKGVQKGFDAVNDRLDQVERGQEDIKLKLDNVAYRFELKELQQRVELLEKKANFK
jgi:BMFP domain-containing protein YqiC